VVTATRQVPATFAEAAAALAAASAEGQTVRIVGSGTKLDWGRPGIEADLELRTTGLDRIVEHNAGDLTATLEAGVPLALAQRTFAAAGQMLALDPPLSPEPGPTIGGVVATADSGPLRHRYGTPRDLVVGATVALSDGTIARAGGKVIKNVAGYDIAKLFAGSFGTLGLLLSVNVRLHSLHESSATALGAATDPDRIANASVALSAFPGEFEALDVAWRDGRGDVLARCAGPQAARRAQRTAKLMRDLGLQEVDVTDEDAQLWERQRAGQRSTDQAVVRVAAAPGRLAEVLRATDGCAGTLVGRVALGSSYISIEPAAIGELRGALSPLRGHAQVLDAPPAARADSDPWGDVSAPALEVMRRIKERFDPSATCNPGLFVGDI
jgi:glycolate oxidase FAD binding subunit